MSFLEKVKYALASAPKISRFELKYGKVKDAEQAWRLYFKYLMISLRQLSTASSKELRADVVSPPLNKEQTLVLGDIFDFLHQTVTDLSYTVLDYVDLMKKFTDSEVFHMILAEFHAELAFQFTNLRQKANFYKRKAEELNLSHTSKYEKYLNEITKLTADSFVNEYLLKNKIPLDGFDKEFLE